MEKKISINEFGIFASIITATVGIGTFSYPGELSSLAGTDGWMVILAGGILSCLIMLLLVTLVKKNNWDSFTSILIKSFGKLFGLIFALAFVLYLICSMCLGLRVFIEVMKMYLLEKTPTEFLIVITILTGVYIIRGGIEGIIRFNEIGFWLMFAPVIFILLLLLSNADFTNILPIMSEKPINYLKSMPVNIYIFKGFEIVLLLLPFLNNKEKVKKISILSIVFITLFYMIIFIFSLAVFTKYMDSKLFWPGITMIKAINIPSTFIESWDGVVMALWILFYFTTFINSFYFSCDILKEILSFTSIKQSSVLVVPFIYLGTLYPENLLELNNLRGTPFEILTIVMVVVIPFMALLTSLKRKKTLAATMLICILFTGCFDRVEIDKRSFISTIGIDAGEDIGNLDELKKIEQNKSSKEVDLKRISVTYGAPDISKLGPQKSAASKDIYVTTDAVTMEDALDKAASKISRNINYGHIKLLVLSSELLEHPDVMREIIDYLQRQPSLNKMMYVLIAQGKAEEYVKFKPEMEQNIETYISGLIQNADRNSTILPVTLNEMLIKLNENENAIMPSLKYDEDKKELMLSGAGVIKNYKLMGYLSQNQTTIIEMLHGKLKGGKESIYIEGHPIDISIEDAKRKITVNNENNKLNFNIDVYLEGQVKGYYVGGKPITKDYINSIEDNLSKGIKDECEEVIKITQSKFMVDPIGFREALEKYHPSIWKEKKDNWDKAYEESTINVNVHTKIRRIGVSK
ncbi:MAG: Ger(x)C family spore germination protein [Solirubrobacterales bacterium]